MSLTSWFLVSSGGTRHRLPREMIFVGRDDCELMMQSRSVDKQHAVINYEASTDEHLVKDLGSLNGTFVNDIRILEQTYVTLKLEDKLRFGYDTNLFTVVRGELKVPEEALKHEKFTSQLQFSKKPFESEGSKSKGIDAKINLSAEAHQRLLDPQRSEEKVSVDLSALPRGTPLYGQPSWWGDEDGAGGTNNQDKDSKLQDSGATGCGKVGKKAGEQATSTKGEALNSYCRESNYFEIPNKELQQKSDGEGNIIYEIATLDPHCQQGSGSGHASFTIEFDESSPGKVTIKDHITKFTDHRQKAKKPSSIGDKDLAGLNTELIAAESKVADWLAQNNPPRLLKEAAEEDTKSVKSDVPVYLKRIQGNKHEDGTQSDYENSTSLKRLNRSTHHKDHAKQKSLEQRMLDLKIHAGGRQQDTASQTAFLIEFVDDDHPRKRRSYSFSLNANATGPEAPYPIPQSRIEKAKAGTVDPKGLPLGLQSGSSSHRVIHSTQHAKLLLKQKSEEPCTSLFSQNILLRSSGSLGHRPPNKQPTVNHFQTPFVNKNHNQLSEKANTNEEMDSSDAKDVLSVSGRKRWVSQWASLASNHAGHDQENGQSESSMLASVENDADMSECGASLRSTGSTTSVQNDRKRRTLPKLPKEESHSQINKHGIRSEVGEKQDTELQEKESSPNVGKKENLYFSNERMNAIGKLDSSSVEKSSILTDYSQLRLEASKNEISVAADSVKKSVTYKTQHEQTKEQLKSVKSFNNPPTVLISKGESSTQNVCKPQKCIEVCKKKGNQKNDVESSSDSIKRVETERKETMKPLVRQGSFTIDKPSSNVPIELIPHISKQPPASPVFPFSSVNNIERNDSVDTDSSLDTTLLLKDTEAVMAFLEARLQDDSKPDDDLKTSSYTQENSISPESDVDTASTISIVAGDSDKKCSQKRKSLGSVHKEKSLTASPSKDSHGSATVYREKTERKNKTHVKEVGSRAEMRKVVRTSIKNRQPSLDLTDDDQTSSLHCSAVSDILSSDQENYSGRSLSKSQFVSSDDKLIASKTTAGKSITLPRPRPTRTSLLRRSRLGETSDTEVMDADRASVASEVSTTSSTSKQTSSKKVLSRIDLLAQPRRTRLGSLSARSDSEATISRSTGSSRTVEYASRGSTKTTSTTDGKSSPRARANSISRLSDAKTKTTLPAYTSPSVNTRWRRLPPEYASTSEDEFGTIRNSPKPSRLRTSPATKVQKSQINGSSPVIAASGALNVPTFKHKAKEQEDYIRDWTAHREEIARISQDLALIAREINDVAGEIDSVTSSGTAPSTTVSTAATTPGSAIDTREELVDRVFDESLNFQKILPSKLSKSETAFRANDSKPQPKETPEPQIITRRKTWSRDDVMGDSLLLSSVFQFSRKIRQTIDKTANKIRLLFKDKERNWDEIEKKIRSESEVPILKTSCAEILSILQELKRIEKQLQVINAMIDPDGSLDAQNALGFSTSLPSVQSARKESYSSHTVISLLPHCQRESRTSRQNIRFTSSDMDGSEANAHFGVTLNRFNPDGKEDSTLHE
ncbi:centrosomal protein of 170 kDa isoform X1 [Bufo gargarizans]|uniref:centrosomal protein of 170 kDa isoform X1 n=1 Tax=Bufo gargarizans TaxID=30331 RepID=UPI001CF50408|nr:centrosomal protein of 170 kDa isoform X1 [Bufo gargarizans]